MSSILKALRKLEEEKARRNAGSPDIALDILKTGPRRKSSIPWVAPVMTVILLACGLAGYVLLEKPVPVPPPMAPGKNIDKRPVMEDPPHPKDTPLQAADSHPVEPPVDTHLRQDSDRQTKKAAGTPLRSATKEALPKPSAVPDRKGPSPAVKEKGSFPEPLPKLLLSGIAYQEERAARLAVVNDLPVMEGTMIEGARVEEIFEDRVRFVYAGRSFEVSLGQSTAAQ